MSSPERLQELLAAGEVFTDREVREAGGIIGMVMRVHRGNEVDLVYRNWHALEDAVNAVIEYILESGRQAEHRGALAVWSTLQTAIRNGLERGLSTAVERTY